MLLSKPASGIVASPNEHIRNRLCAFAVCDDQMGVPGPQGKFAINWSTADRRGKYRIAHGPRKPRHACAAPPLLGKGGAGKISL